MRPFAAAHGPADLEAVTRLVEAATEADGLHPAEASGATASASQRGAQPAPASMASIRCNSRATTAPRPPPPAPAANRRSAEQATQHPAAKDGGSDPDARRQPGRQGQQLQDQRHGDGHSGVFTRAQLLQEVWGYDYYGLTRTVDVHVHVRRLRDKLGPEFEQQIGTVRNVGYRFVPPRRGSIDVRENLRLDA